MPHGIDAARRSLERSLHDDALRYAGAVRGWLLHCDYPDLDKDAVETDLILAHAQMARDGWGDPRVREHTDRVLARVAALSDPQAAASALGTIALYSHVARDAAAVRETTDRLSELARLSARADLVVAADALRGIGLWIDGYASQALEALNKASTAYDPWRDADHRYVLGLDTRAWALSAQASVLLDIDDDVERTLSVAREAVERATCTDHLPTIGVTLMYLSRMQQTVGDRDGARDTLDVLLSLARRYGMSAVESYAAVVQAWCDGDRDAAAANVAALYAAGCRLGLTYYESVIADIDAAHGNWGAAVETLDACLALADVTGERFYVAELLLKKARCLHEVRERCPDDDVDALCAQVETIATQQGMHRIMKKAQHQLREFQLERYSTSRAYDGP